MIPTIKWRLSIQNYPFKLMIIIFFQKVIINSYKDRLLTIFLKVLCKFIICNWSALCLIMIILYFCKNSGLSSSILPALMFSWILIEERVIIIVFIIGNIQISLVISLHNVFNDNHYNLRFKSKWFCLITKVIYISLFKVMIFGTKLTLQCKADKEFNTR